MVRLASNLPVLVDEFQSRGGVHIYFLSHLHEDHTSGLNKNWRNGRIYCSEVTRSLLLNKFEGFDPKRVIALPVNETQTVSLLPQVGPNTPAHDDAKAAVLDEIYRRHTSDDTTMTVTLLHANHCPGAVMFVFEGAFGTIVHTGDFRFHPSMIHETVLANGKHVDRLYLDNTYCDPKCVMPPREVAAQAALDIMRRYVRTHTILIGVDSLGKEELLVFLAEQLNKKIAVSEKRLRALQLLDLPDVFTEDYSSTNVHCMPKSSVTVQQLNQRNKDGMPTIAVLPTCLGFIVDDTFGSGLGSCPYIFTVPYSLHSSFQEMSEFVRLLRPCEIFPVVPDKHADLHTHFRHFLNPMPTTWQRKHNENQNQGRPSGGGDGTRAVTIVPKLVTKRSLDFKLQRNVRRVPEFEDSSPPLELPAGQTGHQPQPQLEAEPAETKLPSSPVLSFSQPLQEQSPPSILLSPNSIQKRDRNERMRQIIIRAGDSILSENPPTQNSVDDEHEHEDDELEQEEDEPHSPMLLVLPRPRHIGAPLSLEEVDESAALRSIPPPPPAPEVNNKRPWASMIKQAKRAAIAESRAVT